MQDRTCEKAKQLFRPKFNINVDYRYDTEHFNVVLLSVNRSIATQFTRRTKRDFALS